jgi:hypothetical protein
LIGSIELELADRVLSDWQPPFFASYFEHVPDGAQLPFQGRWFDVFEPFVSVGRKEGDQGLGELPARDWMPEKAIEYCPFKKLSPLPRRHRVPVASDEITQLDLLKDFDIGWQLMPVCLDFCVSRPGLCVL